VTITGHTTPFTACRVVCMCSTRFNIRNTKLNAIHLAVLVQSNKLHDKFRSAKLIFNIFNMHSYTTYFGL
jgi:hypothetical protein